MAIISYLFNPNSRYLIAVLLSHEKKKRNIIDSNGFVLTLYELSTRQKPKSKRVGVHFIEMGVYLAPVFGSS